MSSISLGYPEDPRRAWASVVVPAQAGPVANAAEHYVQDETPVVLQPMPGRRGRAAARLMARRRRAALRRHRRAEVRRAFGVFGLPLHLRLAFEEARLWPSWEPVAPGFLADDVQGLVQVGCLDRLGSSTVNPCSPPALGCLAAARNGLAEDEELDLLSANPDVDREVATRFPDGGRPISAGKCRPCSGQGYAGLAALPDRAACGRPGAAWLFPAASWPTGSGRGTWLARPPRPGTGNWPGTSAGSRSSCPGPTGRHRTCGN